MDLLFFPPRGLAQSPIRSTFGGEGCMAGGSIRLYDCQPRIATVISRPRYSYQHDFEVYLRYMIYCVSMLGMWDQNIGSYRGLYSTASQKQFVSSSSLETALPNPTF